MPGAQCFNTSCELPLLPGVQLAASTVAVETICLGGALDSVWRLHKLRPRSGRQLCGCQGETGCWETDVLSSQRSARKLAGKLLGASTLTLGCFPGFPVLATGVGMGQGGCVCVCLCGLRRAHGALRERFGFQGASAGGCKCVASFDQLVLAPHVGYRSLRSFSWQSSKWERQYQVLRRAPGSCISGLLRLQRILDSATRHDVIE